MSKNIGVPTLKINKVNAYAVACEALSERYCGDEDYKPDMTQYNEYIEGGYTSGKALAKYWQSEAEAARTTDSRGRQRCLRSDAVIGGAVIIKPDIEIMQDLTREQQRQFLLDAADIVIDIMGSKGLQIDAGVIHYDEGNPHIHIFEHDPEYKHNKKMNLKMFDRFNHELPQEMQKRGWEVQSIRVFDAEKAKTMDEDELKAYKSECRKKKNKASKSAKEYKAEKRAAQIEQEAKDKATQIQADAVMKKAQMLLQAHKTLSEAQEAQKDIEYYKKRFEALEAKLAPLEGELDDMLTDRAKMIKRKGREVSAEMAQITAEYNAMQNNVKENEMQG